MATKRIAIEVVGNLQRLKQGLYRGDLASPGVYLSLNMNDGRGTLLVIPLDYYSVKGNRKKAWDFVKELDDFRRSNIPVSQRFDAFERLYRMRWGVRSPEEWGLALIFWYDVYADELDPKEQLANSLGDWLKVDRSFWRPRRDDSWFQMLIGKRLLLQKSLEWKQLVAFEDAKRLNRLEAFADLGPTFIRMALVILGALPIAAEAVVVCIVYESLIGFLDFLFTMWEAERDGMIDEEEVKDAQFAGLGIIGVWWIQLIILGVRLSISFYEFVRFLLRAAKQLKEELPARVEAAKAGLIDFISSEFNDGPTPDSVFVLLDG